MRRHMGHVQHQRLESAATRSMATNRKCRDCSAVISDIPADHLESAAAALGQLVLSRQANCTSIGFRTAVKEAELAQVRWQTAVAQTLNQFHPFRRCKEWQYVGRALKGSGGLCNHVVPAPAYIAYDCARRCVQYSLA